MGDFEVFWQAYPNKVGKGKAREKFAIALRKTTLDVMLTALAWQSVQPKWLSDGGAYVPHPATWLHQERWDDEPVAMPQMKKQTVQNITAVQRWASKA